MVFELDGEIEEGKRIQCLTEMKALEQSNSYIIRSLDSSGVN